MDSQPVRTKLSNYQVIIASNRGPVSFQSGVNGELEMKRGNGGLITALSGIASQIDATWLACAFSAEDAAWSEGSVALREDSKKVNVKFLTPSEEQYDRYYNMIANPLLWFLQHSMWDVSRAPIIDRNTWEAWDNGYKVVNKLFAEEIAAYVIRRTRPTLVMLQDYHLYLVARLLRDHIRSHPGPNPHLLARRTPIMHFIHIPWPGPEYWGILPPGLRQSLLDGLCAVDLLGLQTRDDGLNFIRTCESYLPGASVKYSRGRVWYRNRSTYVRDFPITIDAENLKAVADSPETKAYQTEIQEIKKDCQLILRIDRIDPSKNIIRGFKAYEEMLELHPEHRERVVFLAVLVPSRLEVEEYQSYLDELMASAGRISARFGNSHWEPVRILVGDDYPRAVASMQIYDVLLVNAIADGMNLVAKEGPLVNQNSGVLILSEKTGARQQLESVATIISPCDIYATAESLHQALSMSPEQRSEKSNRLKWLIEREDIYTWLDNQLDTLEELNLLRDDLIG